MASPTWIKPSLRLSFFFPIEIWTEGFSQSWTRFNHCWGNRPNMLKDSHHSGDKKNSITSELLFTAHITLINHTKTPHTRMNEELANHKWPFFLFFSPDLLTGENSLHQLSEPLLRGHRGRDEGDLHQQPHVEALWELSCGHLQGRRASVLQQCFSSVYSNFIL